MNSNSHDKIVTKVKDSIKNLDNNAQSLVFLQASERTQDLFLEFCRIEKWGQPELMVDLTASIWEYYETENPISQRTPEIILENVPHSDDFDCYLTLFAQDHCITLNCAARCLLDPSDTPWKSAEYILHPFLCAACFLTTGCTYLGESQQANSIYEKLVHDPIYLRELELLNKSISDVGSTPYTQLRDANRKNRWQVRDFSELKSKWA